MKLHELLAVEDGLEKQANKCRTDLAATFEKKRHLFEEKRITFIPMAEGEQPSVEAQSDLQSTVGKELKWLSGFVVKALDASYQVAETNTTARADVQDEDGKVLMKDVPATALLELEKRVAELGTLIHGIPTLDPAKGFGADSQRGEGVFKAREVLKTRTRKVTKPIVKYEATKEHPAQTELITEDVPVGKLQEQEWSGLITPAQKGDLINKVEVLSRAIRRARSRANDATVDTSKKIGDAVVKFIFGD
jgi:hypothetical protein